MKGVLIVVNILLLLFCALVLDEINNLNKIPKIPPYEVSIDFGDRTCYLYNIKQKRIGYIYICTDGSSGIKDVNDLPPNHEEKLP